MDNDPFEFAGVNEAPWTDDYNVRSENDDCNLPPYCPGKHERCSFVNSLFFNCNENACPTNDCDNYTYTFENILQLLTQGSEGILPENCVVNLVAPNSEMYFSKFGTRATTTVNAHHTTSIPQFRTLSNYCGPGNHSDRLLHDGYPPLSLTGPDSTFTRYTMGFSY